MQLAIVCVCRNMLNREGSVAFRQKGVCGATRTLVCATAKLIFTTWGVWHHPPHALNKEGAVAFMNKSVGGATSPACMNNNKAYI